MEEIMFTPIYYINKLKPREKKCGPILSIRPFIKAFDKKINIGKMYNSNDHERCSQLCLNRICM